MAFFSTQRDTKDDVNGQSEGSQEEEKGVGVMSHCKSLD